MQNWEYEIYGDLYHIIVSLLCRHWQSVQHYCSWMPKSSHLKIIAK